ncbi:MAG: hypothetical protein ABI082_13690 [Dokdonella sp.]
MLELQEQIRRWSWMADIPELQEQIPAMTMDGGYTGIGRANSGEGLSGGCAGMVRADTGNDTPAMQRF